jgi:hypothetical protein
VSREYGPGDRVKWLYVTPSMEYEVTGYVRDVLSVQYLVQCDDGMARFVKKTDATLVVHKPSKEN